MSVDKTHAKVKVKVTMAAKVIRAPDSPYKDDDTPVEFENPEQVVELDYEAACSLLGEEVANRLFAGVGETDGN